MSNTEILILLTFLPLDLVLHDRTTGVAGVGAVRRNGEGRVVSDLEAHALGTYRYGADGSRPLADACDVLADDLDVETHRALKIPDYRMVRDAKWFTHNALLPLRERPRRGGTPRPCGLKSNAGFLLHDNLLVDFKVKAFNEQRVSLLRAYCQPRVYAAFFRTPG